MHQAHFHFHHAQACCRFACQQTTADDHDRFLQVGHFAQCERVTSRSQINYVAKTCPCHGRAYRPAAHRQTCLRKFDGFTIGQHGQAPLDVELRHYSAKACLDLVRVEPALIDLLEFLQIRFLFTQKALRNDPALVRRECFRTDQRDGTAFVVFANAFACTCSTYARTNDEIIAPNHICRRAPEFQRRCADKRNRARDNDLAWSSHSFLPCRTFLRHTAVAMNESTTQLKDTTANPAPLGLLGFGMTTVLLNLHNAGFYELNSMILA